MIKWIKKLLFTPSPTLFDVLVGGILYALFLNSDTSRVLYLSFYSIFLFIVSLTLKPKRNYSSLPLALFLLWCFVSMFIHSYAIYPKSITRDYLLFYIMGEGFLHIFCSALFIMTVVKYSTNLRYLYIVLPLTMTQFYWSALRTGSSTPIVAFMIGVVIYLFMAKRYYMVLLASIFGLAGIITHWSWLCMKFVCRPMAWHQLVVNTFYRPVKILDNNIIDPGVVLSPPFEKYLNSLMPHFANTVKPYLACLIGGGFQTDILDSEYIWVDKDAFGWVYKQNDFLRLANDIGLLALILVAWFLVECFRVIGIRPAMIILITIILTCFGQVTMYFPWKATIVLVAGSLAITEGLKQRGKHEEVDDSRFFTESMFGRGGICR